MTGSPALATENVTKRYGQLTAVANVSLRVSHGEFRSVIGPNGAGKTTLFDLVTGAVTPSSGRVRLDGTDVTRLAPHERVRRGLGRSFQITTVFPSLSVRENVRLAVEGTRSRPLRERLFDTTVPSAVTDRTEEVLDRIGLADRADRPAETLDYGSRRRLEIGLVLGTDPTVVLLDEPTAGMGPDETRETMGMIETVLADRTVLLVEHDVELVLDVSDRITVLHRGEEVTTGEPDAVAADPAVQEAYLGGASS